MLGIKKVVAQLDLGRWGEVKNWVSATSANQKPQSGTQRTSATSIVPLATIALRIEKQCKSEEPVKTQIRISSLCGFGQVPHLPTNYRPNCAMWDNSRASENVNYRK